MIKHAHTRTHTCYTRQRIFLFHSAPPTSRPESPHYRDFTITLRHITLGRTPLYDWSTRRRELYLTTRNTWKRYTSMPLAGFEPTVPANERPQAHAVARAVTRFGRKRNRQTNITVKSSRSHSLRNKPRAQVGSSVYSKTYTYIQRHCWNGINIYLIR
jgi:hypothetical protein